MLFTDIEGSTNLARELGDEWPPTLADHHRLVRAAIESAHGHIVGTEGDSFFATFSEARDAVGAASTAQGALKEHAWQSPKGQVRVRMGIHTADVERTDRGFVGLEVHRAARVSAAAHGGQVLLTDATYRTLEGPVRCKDLGVHRLKDFPEPIRLWQLVVDDDASTLFPPPRTLDVRPTNLPSSGMSVIGRERELDAIRGAFLVDGARLVMLTGPGGIGKTTTAIRAAMALLDDHPGGVWFVAGDNLTDASGLIPALAAALQIPDLPGADLTGVVTGFLAGLDVLLVLDNLEHLSGADDVISELLRKLPNAHVLATGRVPLRLISERVIALSSLDLRAASTLMVERARAAGMLIDFDDSSNREAVEAICEKLDGLPLAIELAAARMRLMTPAQVLDRLGSVLELSGAEADRPERHRSLRATTEWTLGLLPSDAQRLFDRLAVFSGPAPLEFIEEVCGYGIDALDAAVALVDYSLLQRAESGLVLAAALRELAAERLTDSEDEGRVRRAHARSMATLGERLQTPANATPEWIRIAEGLSADTWSATAWARQADPSLHRLLVIRFCGWWAFTGRVRSAVDELTHALDRNDVDDVDRGQLLLARGHMLTFTGQGADATVLADEALPLVKDRSPADLGDHLVLASIIYGASNRHEDAIACASQALSCYETDGTVDQLVRALIYLAQASTKSGDLVGAGHALDKAERLAPQVTSMVSEFLPGGRADWALAADDPAGALAAHVESLEHLRFPGMELWAMASIVECLARLDEPAAVLELGAALEEAARELGVGLTLVSEVGEGLRAAMERARAALPSDRAAEIDAAGRSIPPGERKTRALDLARVVSRRVTR